MGMKENFEYDEDEIRRVRELTKTDTLNGKYLDDYTLCIPITFNTYQEGTRWTAQYPEHLPTDVYCMMGLCGEVGELSEKIKKRHRDGLKVSEEKFKEDLTKEAGDALYYLTALCDDYGISLENVAKVNQYKLLDRMSRGVIKGSGDNR